MSKRDTRHDPMGTLPMFDTTTKTDGLVIAAGRFRCGLCNTMGVDEAGELCPVCAAQVLTSKRRYTRTPADPTTSKPTRKPARRPRKTTSSTKTASSATASSSSKPRTSAAAVEGVA